MPRKTVTTASAPSATGVKFGMILEFFKTAPLEIANFAAEMVQHTVKDRQPKLKVATPAAGKTATEAVDAATRSAVGAPAAEGGVQPAKKKKPGPPKGYKKGAAGGAVPATQAADAAQPATPATPVAEHVGENTGTALPPQEGVLDLDAR